MNENNFDNDLILDIDQVVETPIIEPEIVFTEEPVLIVNEPVIESTPVVVEEPVVVPTVEPVVEPIVVNVPEPSDKIALHSSANLFKYKLGELKVGYNIVSKEDSVLWLKSKKVRVATPEEVAQYYNK